MVLIESVLTVLALSGALVNITPLATMTVDVTTGQEVLFRPNEVVESRSDASATGEHGFEDIRQVLASVPAGRDVLAVMDRYSVALKFLSGKGASFRDIENLVVIGSDSSTPQAALDFVHEMIHASYYHEGIAADARSLGRDAYIERMLEEEAEAAVKAIEAKIELEQVPIKTPLAPFERKYKMASLMGWLSKSADGNLTVEEQTRIGRQAGKESISAALKDGEGVGGRSGLPYPVIYGRFWDQVNGGK